MKRSWPGALLALTVLAVFLPAVRQPFIGWDDGLYIAENPLVKAGLSWEGARWAFVSTDANLWHPLTWLSLMANVTLLGTEAWGFHLVNVLLHAASAWLLFEFLRRVTKEDGLSLCAAALWALHPMRVESVRWAAERKDVLSVFFLTLTLLAWLRRLEKPSPGRRAACALAYAAAVLSKASVMTLPFALLLVDAWPLRRKLSAERLREKAELFALAAVAAVGGLWANARIQATFESLPLAYRSQNALVSIPAYLGKTAWPGALPLVYPHPGDALTPQAVAASVLLIAFLSWAAWSRRESRPYLLFGWAWFLLTLAPMLQLVQIGGFAMANHFSYIPHIGLAVAAAWGAADLLAAVPWARPALAAAALAALAVRVRAELPRWSDSGTLFTYTAEATENNYAAHNAAGQYYSGSGDLALAEKHFIEAARLRPDDPGAHVNLGVVHTKRGRAALAEAEFHQALRLSPEDPEAKRDLALLMGAECVRARDPLPCRQAVALSPDDADLHNNLGVVLASSGKRAAAKDEFSRALELRPGFKQAQANLAALSR